MKSCNVLEGSSAKEPYQNQVLKIILFESQREPLLLKYLLVFISIQDLTHLALKYLKKKKKSRTMLTDGEFSIGASKRLLVLNQSDNSPLSPIAQGCNYCPSCVKGLD